MAGQASSPQAVGLPQEVVREALRGVLQGQSPAAEPQPHLAGES